jgi:UDP-N-acetylmuramoyl-L-alanyl-D-glutamate--2,6-diaminopimelate ligase
MGRVAAQWSDLVLLTSDNPRSEEPGAILREIEVGVLEARGQDHRMQAYWVVPDRREAIEQAIAMAHPGDLVLIAGKGHEDYQIIGGERLHFDDSEVAREAIRKQGGPSTGLG